MYELISLSVAFGCVCIDFASLENGHSDLLKQYFITISYISLISLTKFYVYFLTKTEEKEEKKPLRDKNRFTPYTLRQLQTFP